MKVEELSVSEEAFVNWALRECLIYWGSVSLGNSLTRTFDPRVIPSRFGGGESFSRLIMEYGRSKGFISKKEDKLTSKGWKAATSQMKKG